MPIINWLTMLKIRDLVREGNNQCAAVLPIRNLVCLRCWYTRCGGASKRWRWSLCGQLTLGIKARYGTLHIFPWSSSETHVKSCEPVCADTLHLPTRVWSQIPMLGRGVALYTLFLQGSTNLAPGEWWLHKSGNCGLKRWSPPSLQQIEEEQTNSSWYKIWYRKLLQFAVVCFPCHCSLVSASKVDWGHLQTLSYTASH